MRLFRDVLLSYCLAASAPPPQDPPGRRAVLTTEANQGANADPPNLPKKTTTTLETTKATVATENQGSVLAKAATTLQNAPSSSSPPRRRRQKSYDPIVDWKPPSSERVEQTRRRVMDPMKRLTSPVFYSTDDQGVVHQGLGQVTNLYKTTHETTSNNNDDDDATPQAQQGPILFISNHQLAGIDSWLVVNQIQQDCNVWLRALTAPLFYPSTSRNELDGTSWFETFGCLPVSTRHFYRLLQTQQSILLFPGGVVEAAVSSREDAYALKGWKSATDKNQHEQDSGDFVRTAAKFNATIVPFSSIGAAESAVFVNDLPGMPSVPPVVQQALQRAAGPRVPADFRYDRRNADNDNNNKPLVDIPLVLPKPLPQRHYYLFHPPISLHDVHHGDRAACRDTYARIRQDIQRGCHHLLTAAAADAFCAPWQRVPYEQVWQRPAPSVSAEKLNEIVGSQKQQPK